MRDAIQNIINLFTQCNGLLLVMPYILGGVFAHFLLVRVSRAAYQRNLFDRENDRTVHKGGIPRLGGVTFLPVSMLVTYLLSLVCVPRRPSLEELELFVFSTTLLYTIGIVDDLKGLSHRHKFAAQFISVALILFITNTNTFDGLLLANYLPNWALLGLTALFALTIINAINLIDGIDGLAASLSSNILAIYAVLSLGLNEPFYAVVSIAMLGVLTAFLKQNLTGTIEKKTKIFMGDTGALTLGIFFSFIALKLVTITTASEKQHMLTYVIAPTLVPCLDVLYVFARRILERKNPFIADQKHIHHRLLALGLSHRSTLIVIWLYSSAFTVFNIVGISYMNIYLLALLDAIIWIFVNQLISHISNRKLREQTV